MADSSPFQFKRMGPRTVGALLSGLLLGACTTPKSHATNVWISAHLKKTAHDQWNIDCAMIDDCVNDDCDTPYAQPEKRGNFPYDKWVKLADGETYKAYQIRVRLRKATLSGENTRQKPEYLCRTGVFTLCEQGMRHLTPIEKPWLNIQLSDELALDGPNVLIAKGFTHLVSAGTDSNPAAGTSEAGPESVPAADASKVLAFKNVNGELLTLCQEETDLNLGPTWFAAKFAWPSPRQDCPLECPAPPGSLNPATAEAP